MYYFEVIDALRVDCRAYSTHNRPTHCASASHPRDPLQGSPIWSQQGLHTSKSQGAIQHRWLEVEDPSCALCILGYCNFRYVISVTRIDSNCIKLIFDITFTISLCGYIGEIISLPNGARLLVRGLVKRPGRTRPNRLSNSTLEFHQITYQKPYAIKGLGNQQ